MRKGTTMKEIKDLKEEYGSDVVLIYFLSNIDDSLERIADLYENK